MQSFFEKVFGNIDHHLEVLFKEFQEDKGIQNVYTPLNKIETATNFKFSSVLNQNIKKVGILFNAEFIRYILKSFDENYLNNIELTYFYDSEYDRNNVDHIITEYGYKKDIAMISIEEFNEKNKDIKVIEKVMSNKYFDIVFSNPPYNNNLDLQILQQLFNFAEKIVFIHPSSYILDKKFKKKLYNDIRNINYLEYVNLFWGNKLFDIGLFCPLCISIWNTNKQTSDCIIIDNAFKNIYKDNKTNINEISVHGIYFNNFINMIKQYMQQHYNSLQNNITNENKLTDYSVKFSLIRGHAAEVDGIQEDFFSLICLNSKDNYCNHIFRFPSHASVQQKLHWAFNNEQERLNFINYCKSKIVRFYLSLYKINANLGRGELEIIPWMDFTRSWNDKDLCKEFNISKELWEYINKFIPDYYDDYKSGF